LEVHLSAPITKIDGTKRYREVDFITVCPNCHAMLHRHDPPLIVEELRNAIMGNKK
jgi:5-methylcytosine-specific restriction protein A